MKRFIDWAWQARAAGFSPCPMPRVLVPPASGRALVMAPHADDETLGCGGTIALLRRAGWDVRVLVATDGAAGDPLHYVDDVVAQRQAECRSALERLGVDDVNFLGAPDGGFTVQPGVRHVLARELLTFRPTWLLAPAPLDYHRDHVTLSLATVEAWRRHGGGCRLFYYEVWAPLPVTHVVDVASVLTDKRAALAEYALPLRYGNYQAASEGLMAYRGLFLPRVDSSLRFAEGFLEESRTRAWWLPLLHLRRRLDEQLGRQ